MEFLYKLTLKNGIVYDDLDASQVYDLMKCYEWEMVHITGTVEDDRE
jgi:hypothetical protein